MKKHDEPVGQVKGGIETQSLYGGPRTTQRITDKIVAVIRQGRIGIGGKLPGEKALAEDLKVSRPLLREALRVLEAAGIVEVRPGRGCYVVDDFSSLNSNSVWMSWLSLYRLEVLAILEVREALEAKAAELAALRATSEDVAAIRASVDGLREIAELENPDPEQAYLLDLTFHRAVCNASHNALLIKLACGVGGALETDRRATMSIPQRIRKSTIDHGNVCEGIERKNPAFARSAMEAHMQQLREDLRATNVKLS